MIEYRGKVKDGVVVVDGPVLPDGTIVKVIPVDDGDVRLGSQPAFGIWRDRDDLGDSEDAARKLRDQTSKRPDDG